MVLIFGKEHCPYTAAAVEDYQRRDLEVQYIDVKASREDMDRMLGYSAAATAGCPSSWTRRAKSRSASAAPEPFDPGRRARPHVETGTPSLARRSAGISTGFPAA